MEELKAKLQKQREAYDKTLVDGLKTTDPAKRLLFVPRLRDMNLQIMVTIEQIVGILVNTKKDTPELQMYRDELMATLRRIQKEYNALIQESDQLETLRRIREYEETKYDASLHMYLIGILIMALALLIILVVRGYSSATSPTTTTIAPTAAALT